MEARTCAANLEHRQDHDPEMQVSLEAGKKTRLTLSFIDSPAETSLADALNSGY